MLESIENKDPSVLEVRKADFKKKFNTGVPERTTMTMFDLVMKIICQGLNNIRIIHYNFDRFFTTLELEVECPIVIQGS